MDAAKLGWRRTSSPVLMTCTLTMLAAALLPMRALGADAPVRVGERAPALVAPRLDGSVFDLAALRGKVVIINFWATWCAPCRAEMPQLDAFYRRYRARGLELLGVSVDDAQDRDAVVRVMKSFSYPAALAVAAKVNDFGAPIAVPMTWIIDAKGVVRARLMAGNAATLQSLEQAVLPLLPQAAATHAP